MSIKSKANLALALALRNDVQVGWFKIETLVSPGTLNGLRTKQLTQFEDPVSEVSTQILLPLLLYPLALSDVSYVYAGLNSRTASTAGESDEAQYLWPAYAVDQLLLCIRVDKVWVDLNIDARQWQAAIPA